MCDLGILEKEQKRQPGEGEGPEHLTHQVSKEARMSPEERIGISSNNQSWRVGRRFWVKPQNML